MCVADVFGADGTPRPDVSPREVIETGYRELLARARKISDPQWRQAFLENVPHNRALAQQWKNLKADHAKWVPDVPEGPFTAR